MLALPTKLGVQVSTVNIVSRLTMFNSLQLKALAFHSFVTGQV